MYRAALDCAAGGAMLVCAAVSFLVAMVAAVLGFGGLSTTAVTDKILFITFLIIAIIAFLVGRQALPPV
jgi:uncharacterized membrane protein YtjA (UPF0391 family)